MSAPSAPSETSAFNTKAPQISTEEIERIILDAYGIASTSTLLTSERDVTAHIRGHDGKEYVFKLANASEDPRVIEFQNAALSHINAVDRSLPVPSVIQSKDGFSEIAVSLGSEQHVARLLSYLQGIPVYKTASTTGQRQALGRMLARLSLALKDFEHGASSHEILWDLKHSARLQALTENIADLDKRASVEAILERFCTEIRPREATFRQQVVHNDFNPHNVLLDPDDHDSVSGVLDFGDLVGTPLIYDVAVACSYHMPLLGPPLAEAADFLAAYHEVFPLLRDEIDLLFDLIKTRNAMTITITEWRAKRYPENSAYILRNNPRASLALQRLDSIGQDEAQTIFRNACGLD
jgi:hydroxylysine kinase